MNTVVVLTVTGRYGRIVLALLTTPGVEVTGTVAALGEGVTDLALGARVFGVTRLGGYASRVVLPRHQVFPLPAQLTIEQGAGFRAVFMTAYFALYELLRLRPGMVVLVHSAAGGVGGALLQLGKVAGCRMVGDRQLTSPCCRLASSIPTSR